jgi:uncharacterized glyoxalase superfamily protein PhnB
MLNALTPMLWVDDLKATVEFYTTVLEFTCENMMEDWSWAALAKDDVHIMLAKPSEHEENYNGPVFTGSLYINTNEVDLWWEKLKDRCKVLYPIENFEYGMREFCILDNNGYRIQFGKDLQAET